MDDGRWIAVTESSFEREQRGLEAIRTRLPDLDPWYAGTVGTTAGLDLGPSCRT
ncbi:hypothetical protein ACFV4K_27095 [Nocardia sp. NPDC059764]|uniref:hypothetical protein n=1 Tax=Nocardia sp. NPDC059764 TaxID=3346939 RepID=UPI00365E1BF5